MKQLSLMRQAGESFQTYSNGLHWPILLLTLALMSVGLVMVSSASISHADLNLHDPWFYTKRYAAFGIIGLLAGICVFLVPVSFWERSGGLMLVLAIVMLVVVLLPMVGKRVNGSQRWIALGPIAIQTSEMAKFCLIIFYGSFLARHGHTLLEHWAAIFKPLVILGIATLLLLLEPDFGASVVLIGTVMAMLFLAGVKVWQFLLLIGMALGSLFLLATQTPYRLQRLITFRDPWADQFDTGYQLTQSLIAFGRGEWLGLGLGNSVQKQFYLPEAHTDFIFAIIAEELGLVGVILILALFVALVVMLLLVARRALKSDMRFSCYAIFGVAVMFAGQAFINVGVASGLLPTKGLTMPFISYGGSSLLASSTLIALVLRCDWELHQTERDTAKRQARAQSIREGLKRKAAEATA